MCKFCNSYEESLHLGVCKLVKCVRKCVVIWKNLHSWQKFYTPAGRDGRDKFQVCSHFWRKHYMADWWNILKENILEVSWKYLKTILNPSHLWKDTLSGRRRVAQSSWYRKSFLREGLTLMFYGTGFVICSTSWLQSSLTQFQRINSSNRIPSVSRTWGLRRGILIQRVELTHWKFDWFQKFIFYA